MTRPVEPALPQRFARRAPARSSPSNSSTWARCSASRPSRAGWAQNRYTCWSTTRASTRGRTTQRGGFRPDGRRELPRRLGPHRRTLAGAGRRHGTGGEPRLAGCRQGQIGPGFGTPTGSTSRSYADSKIAQVVFAGELRRRSAAAGAGVHAVAAHPGWSQTRIVDPPPPALGELAGNSSAPCSHRPTAPSPSCWQRRTRIRAPTTARPTVEARPAHRDRRRCHGVPWSPASARGCGRCRPSSPGSRSSPRVWPCRALSLSSAKP